MNALLKNLISLEAKIAKNKDLYYDALGQAQKGWHEGTGDVLPFIKYLLGTVLAAYKDFEDRFALIETKLPALETVRHATMNKIGRFTKQDIQYPALRTAAMISSAEAVPSTPMESFFKYFLKHLQTPSVCC